MQFEVITVTPFQQNCSLIWCEETGKAALVDPGGDPERIAAAVAAAEVELERILLTHAHIDHVGAAAELGEKYGVPIEGPHRDDEDLLEAIPEQGKMFGLPAVPVPTPARWLEAGDTVDFGAEKLEVLHCPGHSPGHVVFLDRAGQLAISGDVLFSGSIGRADLPGGDLDVLLRSIREQLWPLGEDVAFLPGHGPMSTFGQERRTNPFVGD